MNKNRIQIDGMVWTFNKRKLQCKLNFSNDNSFFVDPVLDIGIFLISLGGKGLMESGDTLKAADYSLIPISMIKYRENISLGDELYFVGFPFGIGTDFKIEPVIRSGSVAWISEYSSEFYLDAFSYGGNSGSPVFTKRLLESKTQMEINGVPIGGVSMSKTYLVGMIVGHINETINDVLHMAPKSTSFDLITLKQNLGLARGIWIDEILKHLNKVKNLSLPVF